MTGACKLTAMQRKKKVDVTESMATMYRASIGLHTGLLI